MSINSRLSSIKIGVPILDVNYTENKSLPAAEKMLKLHQAIFASFVYKNFGLHIEFINSEVRLSQSKLNLSNSQSTLQTELQELFTLLRADFNYQEVNSGNSSGTLIWSPSGIVVEKIEKIAALVFALEQYETKLSQTNYYRFITEIDASNLEERIQEVKYSPAKFTIEFKFFLQLYFDLLSSENTKMVIDQLAILDSFNEDAIDRFTVVPSTYRIKINNTAVQTSQIETSIYTAARITLSAAAFAALVYAASQVGDCNYDSTEQAAPANPENSN